MNMGKMSFKQHNALKATFTWLLSLGHYSLLVCGCNAATQDEFCKLIDLRAAARRLLSCTRISIRSLGFWGQIESNFVSWFQAHAKSQGKIQFCNLLSPHNWLKYNISPDLVCMQLGIGHVDYYVLMRSEWLQVYRRAAFGGRSITI